jgi:poly-gamma-glutamate synthesis protein (capsule biosynthesis protein)
LLAAALTLFAAPAHAQLPPVATVSPTPAPSPTPEPSSPRSRVHVRPVVGPGGRYVLRQRGLTLPARLEVRRGARWRTVRVLRRRRPVRRRAPLRPARLRFRGVGADGFRTPVARLRVRWLRLAAVGDVNLGNGPGAEIAAHGPRYPWASVGRPLRAADLAFANLECAVSRRGTAVRKEFTFRGRPAALRAAARRGGLDVVNLANNHAGDFGDVALMDTLRWARRFGIAPVGAGRDAARAYRPRVVRRLGLRVAFVGFSTILPFEFQAGPSDPGTAWGYPDRVRRAVQRARRRADVVVATFHWGIERDFHPDPRERALARVAVRAGANAIIAGHPHVLQPIDRRRRRVLAWSLGNFVFSANSPGTESTGILHLRVGRRQVRYRRFQRATIIASRPIL